MMKRRDLLKTLVAAPMILTLPRMAFAATRNPASFGAIGAGNDTAAINAALSAIRSDGGGILQLDNLTGYDVGPLNATNCSRLKIEIDPVCIVRGSKMVAGAQAPVFDLSYSHEVEIHGGSVFAGIGDPWSPTQPPVLPLALFYIAGNVDKVRLVNVKATGWCQSAIVAICSSVSVTLDMCQIMQRQGFVSQVGSAPPALMLSSDPYEWQLKSAFQNNLPNQGFVTWIDINDTELHHLATGTSGWTTYMRNAAKVTFKSGASDCSLTGHVLFQGNADNISSFGQRFYSESGVNAQYIYQNGGAGTITDLAAYNPSPHNLIGAFTSAAFAGMSGTGVIR